MVVKNRLQAELRARTQATSFDECETVSGDQLCVYGTLGASLQALLFADCHRRHRAWSAVAILECKRWQTVSTPPEETGQLRQRCICCLTARVFEQRSGRAG